MSKPCKKIDLWKAVIMAIAAAVVAALPLMCNGCAIAVDGRIATWAATPGKIPPPVPTWATAPNAKPATQPSD